MNLPYLVYLGPPQSLYFQIMRIADLDSGVHE